ncbi:MAG: ATP-dependent DNA helicase [Candidatus Gracilibacteria bacterium]|nr:ATP-dependent DNA helicase [Candidatus Gracilibacteria bacterium]
MQNTDFQTEYNKLNEEQKEAVDTIYGPVMVVAGPGAGKTQILALRVANIILKTGTNPENILITTFTEAGVVAIKKRLVNFLGLTAYKVNVSTIHSLCSDIISSFPEKFVEFKAGTLIDEIESLEIIKTILDKMIEDGKIVELKSDADKYIYLRDIKSRISTLKQEAVDYEYFKIKIEDESARLQEELELVKNKTTKTFANKEERARKQIAKLYELREIYREFNNYCRANSMYDFSDLITFVLEKIKIDEELKYYYMERFQFIMIDEYQDTNNAQNEILSTIIGEENPNIMTVGDDDQSIYRFQGANIENMLDFSTNYPETKFIVMDKNYRSNQDILDTSESLIKNNQERLTSKLTFLNKNLTRAGKYENISNKPKVFAALNPLTEKAFILEKINKFLDEKIESNEIAIIVRNNREVEEWSTFLNQNGIIVESKQKTDILKNSYVLLLLDILEIIDNPFSDDYRLLNFLRSEVCKADNIDVLNINKSLYNLNYSRKEKLNLFSYLEIILKNIKNADNLDFEIKNKEALENIIEFISESISGNFASKSLYEIVSLVLEKLNFVDFVEKNGDFSDLEDIYTFFNKIKTWNERDRELNIPKLLRKINLHRNYNINISRQILKENASGVQVLTAHGSKGLEYEVVFIPGLYNGNWDNKRNINKLKLPNLAGNGLQNTKESSEEEDRRLFFVALTRAKNHLFLSYPLSRDNKIYIESSFLGEIKETLEEIKDETIDTSKISEIVKNDLTYHKTKLKDEELEYIKTFLENYKLSASDLNTFLSSPVDFLHRVIFKYPFIGNEFTIFGSVYHRVLELFYIKYKDSGILPEKSYLTETFKLLIKKEILSPEELERLTEKGVNGLSGYYDNIAGNISVPLFLEYNFRSKNVLFDGIPLTGKIDKVEMIGNSTDLEENTLGQASLFEQNYKKLVRFVDYKTGRAKSENEIKGLTANSEGQYFRQLLFYDLMASLDREFIAKHEIGGLAIDFVEGKDGNYRFIDIPYTREDLENLKEIIKDSRNKICDLEFWRELV